MYKILVVDDEFRIRQIIRKYAEFEGYEVDEAVDGMQAIQVCRKENFDAVICVEKAEQYSFSSSGFPEKFGKIVCGYGNIPIKPPEYGDGSFLLWLKESSVPAANLKLSFDGRTEDLFCSTVMLTAASC